MFEDTIDRHSPSRVRFDFGNIPTLYHYTDAAGLIGMLSSSLIWATEYRFLNDKTEVQHTRNLVRRLISRKLRDNPSKMSSDLYTQILDQLSDPRDAMEIYFFSLSEEPDSLSQWRGYARDGRGFTIGFDAQKIATKSEKQSSSFGLCKVEYAEAVQLRGLEVALTAIEEECRKIIDAGEFAEAEVIEDAANSYDTIVWNRSVMNKHDSFASEKEWRLFSFFEDDDLQYPRVRSRGSDLVPYVEITAEALGGGKKLPIQRIGIGPGFSENTQRRSVDALCRQEKYKPEIYLANAPYRAG